MIKLPVFKNNKGFTLIELLTVISIISILTALLTVSFVSVSQRGRDGQRKSNIRQIQAALELFRADNNSYPQTVSNTIGVSNASVACGASFVFSSITYMQKMPCDPKTEGLKYFYLSTPSGCSPGSATLCTGYTLASCIDNSGDKEVGTKPPQMTVCSPAYYFVTTNP